jgi:hypothetical protein
MVTGKLQHLVHQLEGQTLPISKLTITPLGLYQSDDGFGQAVIVLQHQV